MKTANNIFGILVLSSFSMSCSGNSVQNNTSDSITETNDGSISDGTSMSTSSTSSTASTSSSTASSSSSSTSSSTSTAQDAGNSSNDSGTPDISVIDVGTDSSDAGCADPQSIVSNYGKISVCYDTTQTLPLVGVPAMDQSCLSMDIGDICSGLTSYFPETGSVNCEQFITNMYYQNIILPGLDGLTNKQEICFMACSTVIPSSMDTCQYHCNQIDAISTSVLNYLAANNCGVY